MHLSAAERMEEMYRFALRVVSSCCPRIGFSRGVTALAPTYAGLAIQSELSRIGSHPHRPCEQCAVSGTQGEGQLALVGTSI